MSAFPQRALNIRRDELAPTLVAGRFGGCADPAACRTKR